MLSIFYNMRQLGPYKKRVQNNSKQIISMIFNTHTNAFEFNRSSLTKFSERILFKQIRM